MTPNRRNALALLALCFVLGAATLLRTAVPAHAQNEAGTGWIEGVVVNEAGKPVNKPGDIFDGAIVTIQPKEGKGFYTPSDRSRGGFYTFRNLKPGIYELFVNASYGHNKQNEQVDYRPQHHFGISVQSDKREVLNITVHEGNGLEEFGKPDVTSEKAIILAEELARLRKEVEELKKIVEELKKKP